MCRQAPTGGPKPPRRCPMPGKFTLFLRYEGQFTVLFAQPECIHRHPALQWGRKRSALHRSSQRIAHGIAARCKGHRTALHRPGQKERPDSAVESGLAMGAMRGSAYHTSSGLLGLSYTSLGHHSM